MILLLVVGTVALCAVLWSLSHSYYVRATTSEAEGTVISLDTAENLGYTDLSGRYVLKLENDTTQYTFPEAEGARIARQLRLGESVSLQYENATFHTVVALHTNRQDGENVNYQLRTIADRRRMQVWGIAVAVYAVFVLTCAGVFVRNRRKRSAAGRGV